jgi:hypothetical protein
MHQDQSNLEKQGTGAGVQRRVNRRSALGALAGMLVVAALTMAGPAYAAGGPTVTTGGAQAVSFSSATLTGTIDPNGANTSYYFQYGPTKLYGFQTAIADAGAGSKTVTVKLAIAGLAPLTEYHYRLVAVNAAAPAAQGGDRHFETTKVPLSLAILSSPNPVPAGGSVTIQGTLSGTNNASRQVVLQENPFPFAGAFVNVPNVNVQLTSATGGFVFTVPGAIVSSQYRVVTTGNPPVISPVTTENVAVKVASHVARTKRRGFVRIFGTVTPAENGAQIGILRIAGGRGVLVGGTVLKSNGTTTSSSYSRVVKVRRGVYRVLARVVNQPVVSSYGSFLRIG